MKRLVAVALGVVLPLSALAGRLPTGNEPGGVPAMPDRVSRETVGTGNVEGLRMQKRFGFGVGAAGPLAVFGLKADANVTENFSIGIGYGTGIEYSTWLAECRFFLLGNWISPYIGFGFARWWTDGTKEKQLGPTLVNRELLRPGEDPANGFSMFLAYPALGVQLMHPLGFALSLEVQQLFRLFSMANATYGGVSFHWYL